MEFGITPQREGGCLPPPGLKESGDGHNQTLANKKHGICNICVEIFNRFISVSIMRGLPPLPKWKANGMGDGDHLSKSEWGGGWPPPTPNS